MKALTVHRSRFHSWAGGLAAVLMVSYLALTGEAIHCEYFAQDQEGHHHSSPSSPISHSKHCHMVNHCAAAVIHSAVAGNHLPLQLLGLISFPNPVLAGTDLGLSKAARAPPSV